jgi:hypothetical protein
MISLPHDELLPLDTSPLRVEDCLLLDESGALNAYRKTELMGDDRESQRDHDAALMA